MEIHKKINSKEEYIEYFKYLLTRKNIEDVWKDEDRPILEPFFNWSISKNYPMPEEVKPSFDHWVKCREEYANDLFEIRDSLMHIDEYTLAEAFGFEPIENEEEEIEDYELDIKHTYPLIVTGFIDSSWDRGGKSSACIIRFVYLSDFNEEK